MEVQRQVSVKSEMCYRRGLLRSLQLNSLSSFWCLAPHCHSINQCVLCPFVETRGLMPNCATWQVEPVWTKYPSKGQVVTLYLPNPQERRQYRINVIFAVITNEISLA